ncbi:hypothetical protein [Paractinoplanes brasiliensis]|uniref:hypothetical protein n=1 Tax=Paractinoplanes brasiliensis TaxID=52695 RepID=UPI00105EFD8F|nr:hypothetical protein [Actinoplanes brasiliensis]
MTTRPDHRDQVTQLRGGRRHPELPTHPLSASASAEGGLLTIDLGNDRVDEHPLGSAPVSAVASLSTGRLVVADREGPVTVMDPPVAGGDEAGQPTPVRGLSSSSPRRRNCRTAPTSTRG